MIEVTRTCKKGLGLTRSIYNSAKGVQLEMSTHGGEYFSDALVMGNMGYFQTIADPGLCACFLNHKDFLWDVSHESL